MNKTHHLKRLEELAGDFTNNLQFFIDLNNNPELYDDIEYSVFIKNSFKNLILKIIQEYDKDSFDIFLANKYNLFSLYRLDDHEINFVESNTPSGYSPEYGEKFIDTIFLILVEKKLYDWIELIKDKISEQLLENTLVDLYNKEQLSGLNVILPKINIFKKLIAIANLKNLDKKYSELTLKNSVNLIEFRSECAKILESLDLEPSIFNELLSNMTSLGKYVKEEF